MLRHGISNSIVRGIEAASIRRGSDKTREQRSVDMINGDQGVLPLLRNSFDNLAEGTFSRHGGVSKNSFASNNIGFDLGDDDDRVLRNREKIKAVAGLDVLVSAKQVHGDDICHLRTPVAGDCVIDRCDALTTDRAGVGLMIGHADCQAAVLYDRRKKVIGAVHSGWRGSGANILGRTVAAMEREYGSNPADLEVGVSPSLGPCCSEFVNYREELPRWFWKYLVKDNHFDFWKITLQQLLQAGVREKAVSFAGICTSCSVEYFSYRRACRLHQGITGRNATIIAMTAGE